jgi:hypothetical protein
MTAPHQRRFAANPAYSLGVITAILILLAGCGSTNNVRLAEQGTGQFHSQLDSEQYRAAYAQADENLHKAATETDFVNLLQGVHQKLGRVQRSQRRNYQINWSTAQGTVVTLIYDTAFDGGNSTEQFAWRIRDNQPALIGYHINSNALIAK